MAEDKQHELLLQQIVGIEWRMFLAVETSIPSACQEQPETFRLMRKASFCVLSNETLEAYLRDLQEGLDENRNLMTLKYARIDNMIPPLSADPMIDRIVEVEGGWLRDLAKRYPLTFKGRTDYAAGVYLRSELETYSSETLQAYWRDVQRAVEQGRNLTAERYTYVFQNTGYASIDDVERERKKPQ